MPDKLRLSLRATLLGTFFFFLVDLSFYGIGIHFGATAFIVEGILVVVPALRIPLPASNTFEALGVGGMLGFLVGYGLDFLSGASEIGLTGEGLAWDWRSVGIFLGFIVGLLNGEKLRRFREFIWEMSRGHQK